MVNSEKYQEKLREEFKNINVIESRIKNNIIWDNLVIPLNAIKHGSDIIFYPKSSSCLYKIPGKSIVSTIHGLIYKREPEHHPFYINLYWRVVGKAASIVADRIITVSKNDKHDLLSENYNEEKIEIIPIGINKIFTADYSPEITSQILETYELKNEDYIVQLGHVTKKKNQLYSLRLLKSLIENQEDLKIVFIGSKQKEKSYFKKVKEYARENNLQENVIFTGVIDQNETPSEIPVLLNNSRLALFPSTYEGFGIPAIESIAAGTPLICSDRGSLPEVIGKQNTTPLNLKKWENTALYILKNPSKRQELLARQKESIQKYRWESIAQEYKEVFKEVSKK